MPLRNGHQVWQCLSAKIMDLFGLQVRAIRNVPFLHLTLKYSLVLFRKHRKLNKVLVNEIMRNVTGKGTYTLETVESPSTDLTLTHNVKT